MDARTEPNYLARAKNFMAGGFAGPVNRNPPPVAKYRWLEYLPKVQTHLSIEEQRILHELVGQPRLLAVA